MLLFNRRVARFLLLDILVILVLVGLFAAVNHAFVPRSSGLSERILITPEPSGTPNSSEASSVIPDKIHVEPAPEKSTEIEEISASDSIDLKHLRAVKVKVSAHKIEMGENYWTIATDNKITIYTLIGANPTLPFKAAINQALNILSRKGVLHSVEKGETTASIADLYKVDEKTVKDENHITWWNRLRDGDVLFVPDVRPVRMLREWHNYFSNRGFFGDPLATWGAWTSGFGLRTDPLTGEERHHKGIDLRAKYGDPVYAAASGKVIFTGVSGGFGNLIQIKHAQGYISFYGHLSKIYAKRGQKVRRGTLIGRVGATGRVTGPHLHFEIHKNGKAINPLPLI
jgi:murein DD-endopeptidase MepM/ murein hydrolase activator NlpD